MDEFGRSELHYAVIDQEKDVVAQLLESGVNVNIQDNSLALRLSWYQDKLENGSTLDEAKMAREMAASFTLNHRG